MRPPSEVLNEYADFRWRSFQYLGNHGGFSGARLWRLETSAGDFCLKAWPAHEMTPERLTSLHQLLADGRRRGLDFLPPVVATCRGRTFVAHQARWWVLTAWMPGTADYHTHPSPTRLAAACAALAQLHLAWQGSTTPAQPCPAVQRRLRALGEWEALFAGGWPPTPSLPTPFRDWATRIVAALPRCVARARHELTPWTEVSMVCHACWCDPWHDHLLFTGDRVTGLVDYGSVKLDHPAVDLARLLGSLAGDDDGSWQHGLAAYAALRPLAPWEYALARVLDRTGVVVAAAKWLRWLYHDRRTYDNPQSVAARLGDVGGRLERIYGQPSILV
ncbi:MAG: phosphotransferase [Gemmataceae bacterium]|nr:phosphotransferase [Gemmataceae bacterium]